MKKGKLITIKCTHEQGLCIYEKKCLNGMECRSNNKCENCHYNVENIDFDIPDKSKK